jgi:hypothetical protein
MTSLRQATELQRCAILLAEITRLRIVKREFAIRRRRRRPPSPAEIARRAAVAATLRRAKRSLSKRRRRRSRTPR